MLEYYIWINELKGISIGAKKRLIKQFGNPKCVFEASLFDLDEEYYKNETFKNDFNAKDLSRCNDIVKENEIKKIKIITIDDVLYKKEARNFESSPIILYYKGVINAERKNIAMVGTRKATEYGKIVTRLICQEYLNSNPLKYSIVSGLAVGIDTIAHDSAIEFGAVTYAFVANGLDICYPKENNGLMQIIEKQGAVISPYTIGTSPRKYNFIRRNEIMALWSDEVVVVEGGLNSGAINTGKYALRYKKIVYAVPNSIFINTSEGCNNLIKKGAVPFLCDREDLKKQIKNNTIRLNKLGRLIIEFLRVVPLETYEILLKLNCEIDLLQKELFLLELENLVKYKSDGKWHYIGW